MFNRIFQLLLFACLVTSTVCAANDPFAGKWKVNPSKSKLIDEMKVEAAGPNTFKLTFTGDAGGARGAEESLITKECLGFYA